MKVYKAKARVDYPNENIKAGTIYHFVKPKKSKNGGVEKVRRSTLDEINQWVRSYMKRFQGEHAGRMDEFRERMESDDTDELQDLITDLESYKVEKEERLENMPEQLRESHILNEQISEVEDLISEVENLLE